jgi:hypothetical protein
MLFFYNATIFSLAKLNEKLAVRGENSINFLLNAAQYLNS